MKKAVKSKGMQQTKNQVGNNDLLRMNKKKLREEIYDGEN